MHKHNLRIKYSQISDYLNSQLQNNKQKLARFGSEMIKKQFKEKLNDLLNRKIALPSTHKFETPLTELLFFYLVNHQFLTNVTFTPTEKELKFVI